MYGLSFGRKGTQHAEVQDGRLSTKSWDWLPPPPPPTHLAVLCLPTSSIAAALFPLQKPHQIQSRLHGLWSTAERKQADLLPGRARRPVCADIPGIRNSWLEGWNPREVTFSEMLY